MNTLEHNIKAAWDMRNKHKTDDDNILRISNAFNVSEDEVREILDLNNKDAEANEMRDMMSQMPELQKMIRSYS